MSKLNAELLSQCVDDMLAYSQGKTIKVEGEDKKGKLRNFTETVELQVRRLVCLASNLLTHPPTYFSVW